MIHSFMPPDGMAGMCPPLLLDRSTEESIGKPIDASGPCPHPCGGAGGRRAAGSVEESPCDLFC